MIILIAAIGPNRELGFNNQLIYHSKEDMRFFRECTLNSEVVMGRKTLESIGGPLPNRTNFVVTHNAANMPKDVTAITDLDSFLDRRTNLASITYVIGGASIYKQALDYAEHLYLTEFEEPAEADAFFPEFNPAFYHKKKIQDIEGGVIYDYEFHSWKIPPRSLLL